MTTDHAALREARAAGIDAAVDHVSAYLDASAVGMEAAGVPSAHKYLEPLEHVLEDLRKLAAETRGKPATECTGLTAAWCPSHGDCTCPDREDAQLDHPTCPLHGHTSDHGDPVGEAAGRG